MELYGQQKAHRMSALYIGSQTKLTIPKNKRNGRTREEHLKRMTAIRELDYKLGDKKRPVNDKCYKKLKIYLCQFPYITNKSKIARELGISRKTVHLNYDRIKQELASELADQAN